MTDIASQRDIARRLEQTQVIERPLTNYGATKPSSWPISVPFFDTVAGFWVFWDGSRWLTVHETAHPLKINDTTAPVTYALAGNSITVQSPYRSDYSLYITRVASVTLVAATNNGTNFWTYSLRGLLADGTIALTIHTFSTAADAAGAQSAHDSAPNTNAVVGSRSYFDIVVTKTLAPGALTYWSTVYYRLVIP